VREHVLLGWRPPRGVEGAARVRRPPAREVAPVVGVAAPGHGDFVAVRSGLKEGDTIVSTGVFKLRNGQTVTVENTLSPEFKLSPKPSEN
jgi:membrane fusion protein (multidrug efflux system)